MIKAYHLFLILSVFLSLTDKLYARESVILVDTVTEYPLERYLQIAEDRKKIWTVDNIISGTTKSRFTVEKGDIPYYTRSVYWVKFSVIQKNIKKKPAYFLQINNPILDKIDFYLISPSGDITIKKTGDIYPFTDRDYHHRSFIFKLPDFKADLKYTLALRFETTSAMKLPLTILTERSLLKTSSQEQYFFGTYAGLFFAIIVYMLIIFLFLRDTNYLFFAFFAFSYGLYLLSLHGVSYQLLWPRQPFIQKHSMLFLGGVTMAAGLFFTKKFLNTANHSKTLDRIVSLSGSISIPLSLLLINMDIVEKYLYMYIFVQFTTVVCLFTGVMIALKREKMAYYYLAAQSIPGITAIIYGFQLFQLIAENRYIFYAPVVGSAIQMLLLSIALSDKMRMAINRDKASQRLAIKLLKQNEAHKIKLIQKETHPHFLFNALDSIYYLLEKDRNKAARALIMLADNYRFMLTKAPNDLIRFEEEWTFVENYLKIERLFIGDELSIEFQKDNHLNDIQIPPLTLQPVVENCLKHGFKTKRQNCRISIHAKNEKDGMMIDVTDNGTGYQEKDIFKGTLGNVSRRLRYFYKTADLTVLNRDKGGVKATIYIPGKYTEKRYTK